MRVLRLVEETAPRVMENTLDSKKHMEEELKKACEHLIASQTQFLIGPLLSFFNKLGKTDSKQGSDVPTSSTPPNIEELLQTLQQMVADNQEARPPSFRYKLSLVRSMNALYLGNKLTEKILFKPVRRTLLEVFAQLRFYVDQNLHKTSTSEDQESTSITIGGTTPSTAGVPLRVDIDRAINTLESPILELGE